VVEEAGVPGENHRPWASNFGSNRSYKPITNTAWVRARLCKLQKRMHSTRSRKWQSLPVAIWSPWYSWSIEMNWQYILNVQKQYIFDIEVSVLFYCVFSSSEKTMIYKQINQSNQMCKLWNSHILLLI
jgi:hypothetical protein